MSAVDDYGRCESDPDLLRARLFPLQMDKWPISRVQSALQECSNCCADDGQMLIICYAIEGSVKKLLQIMNFRQQTRSAEKYPGPSVRDLRSRCVADAEHLRTQSYSESYSYSESEPNSEQQQQPETDIETIPEAIVLPMQHEYPETLKVLREHDAAADAMFCVRIAEAVARAIAGDDKASCWTPEKQQQAISDRVLAKCCRESFATPRKGPHGTGLLLATVPRIVLGGKTNYA